MIDLWPCHVCGTAGVRNLGIQGYCSVHLAQLYATFDRGIWAYNGVGLQEGPLRADYGSTYANLRCNACDATWVGPIGDPCGWCQDAYLVTITYQAELALRPPDVHPDDARWPNAMVGWAQRLYVAVQAGIIDQGLAERSLLREKTRHVAQSGTAA